MSPRQLVIPTEIYEAGHDRLSASLEKLANQIAKGKVSKEDGVRQGAELIEECYRTQLDRFNKYVERRRLTGVTGTEKQLLDAKEDAIQAWTRIVSDL